MKAVFLTLILFLVSLSVSSQTDEVTVKAAFIYNFSKHIAINPKNGDEIKVVVVKNKTLSDKISQSFQGKMFDKFKVSISYFESVNNIPQDADIVIAEKYSNSEAKLLKKLSVFVISDLTESEPNEGAIISFFLEGSKLRFLVDKKLLDESHYKISSRLLTLAKVKE